MIAEGDFAGMTEAEVVGEFNDTLPEGWSIVYAVYHREEYEGSACVAASQARLMASSVARSEFVSTRPHGRALSQSPIPSPSPSPHRSGRRAGSCCCERTRLRDGDGRPQSSSSAAT